MELPLKGVVVIELCQYLSGPSASLRLADMGARVIKVERTGTGDAGRKLAIKNLWAGDDSLLFHTINRNKESLSINLKDEEDKAVFKKLLVHAHVLIHNFRPGVMEAMGLAYNDVKNINEKLIFCEISGYGRKGDYASKPGQDLLVQALSGLCFTTGNGEGDPVPFGISVADILCGAQLVQAILGALIRRDKKGIGAHIEISLMESVLDFQFELLTTYFATGVQPARSMQHNGHSLLGAPYGIYKTTDGYIAIAMIPLTTLATALDCDMLHAYTQDESFEKRDEIKNLLATCLVQHSTEYWLSKLHTHDLWAMEVLDWQHMMQQNAYKSLHMEQQVLNNGHSFTTTRCPIRINNKILRKENPAPAVGAHTQRIKEEFLLNK